MVSMAAYQKTISSAKSQNVLMKKINGCALNVKNSPVRPQKKVQLATVIAPSLQVKIEGSGPFTEKTNKDQRLVLVCSIDTPILLDFTF